MTQTSGSVNPTVNHPDKPEWDDETEDYTDYLMRCASHWLDHPPAAPPGFQLVPCDNEPRHWPEYAIVDDDFYPGACSRCQFAALAERNSELQCAAHGRWRTAKLWSWLSGKAYAIGLTSGGCHASCICGKWVVTNRWRGKRCYILGVKRETWRCWRSGHRRGDDLRTFGYCGKCIPWSCCGSTAYGHKSGCEDA